MNLVGRLLWKLVSTTGLLSYRKGIASPGKRKRLAPLPSEISTVSPPPETTKKDKSCGAVLCPLENDWKALIYVTQPKP